MQQVIKISAYSLLLPAIFGCSSIKQKEVEQLKVELVQQKKQNKSLKRRLSLLKDKNVILKGLLEQQKKKEKQPQLALKVDEKSLYGNAMSAFRQKDAATLSKITEIYLKTYPQSAYVDNSIYLNAALAASERRWEDIKFWSYRLQVEYPYSNKLAEILLLEAQASRALNQAEKSQNLLLAIDEQFPGSVAATKAQEILGKRTLVRAL